MVNTYKFGCKPSPKDERNIKFSAVMKKIVVPKQVDDVNVPTPMFANDNHGDCVIAGRAHQTLRYELKEQKKVLPISDSDVLTEWRKENGNTEDGLYILDSLKAWRKGWIAAGKKYTIKAFSQIEGSDEVKKGVVAGGVIVGVSLPDSWSSQFEKGEAWDDTSEDPNQNNGHCICIPAYNSEGPICITWGKRQQMSWDYFEKYSFEAFLPVDAKNKFINQKKLDRMLAVIH